MEEVLEKARRLAREALGDGFDHGYPHVLRVRKWAWEIVREERLVVDSLVLDLAVYLHDIGRVIGEPHAYYSALFAKSFLESQGVGRDVIDKVVNAIEYHSYSYAKTKKVEPVAVEAMVLSDADKLDALGIVGFLRVFSYNWRKGSSLEEVVEHFYEKIFNLKNMMHFTYSRAKAGELTERARAALVYFIEELPEEDKSRVKAVLNKYSSREG
ncbi:HD domain-containing protein [Thermogladius sp. 4427co]|uniref:HD domain-containing protein n=1 Tax=Thermogladius sp. 4427co TaxID=3450718 RepID=UPI003F79186B